MLLIFDSVSLYGWYASQASYIYILSDCFVVSQLFRVAKHVARLKLGSKPTQLFIRLSIIPLSQQMNHVSSGIIRY